MSALQSNTGRRIGITKLIIDPGLPMKNGTVGRNLIIGVPQQCQTVGDFKRHLTRNYLGGEDTAVDFWVDKFCIPDDEDSTFFSVLSEPIRVIGLNADEVDKKITASITIIPPTPASNVAMPSTPLLDSNNIEILCSKLPKHVKFDSSVVSYSKKADNEFSPIRNTKLAPTFAQPLVPEKKLTASAKRRKRLIKSLENKLAIPVSQISNEVISSPSESQDVEQGLTRQSVTKPKAQALFSQAVAGNNKGNTCHNSENRGVRISQEAKRTPALTKEKTSSRPTWERRPDTPRMPKSFKNPAALEAFKRLDFCKEKEHVAISHMKAIPLNLQDTFRQVADNISKSSISIQARKAEKPASQLDLVMEVECDTSDAADGVRRGEGSQDSKYEKFPLLLSSNAISENSIIAFKVMEMGEDYQPVVSNFKEATVIGKPMEGTLTLEYIKHSSVVRSGKFEIEGYESEETENPTTINFSILIEPRLIRPPCTTECNAAALTLPAKSNESSSGHNDLVV